MQSGHKVTVVDNLTSGNIKNLERWVGHSGFSFIDVDLKNAEKIRKAVKDQSTVFHFAANPEVRIGETRPRIHFEENLVATFSLLEALRQEKAFDTLVFASTSTVYGTASMLPTPENYAPLIPISTYGASKLGCEALISSYAHTFGFRALMVRLANIIGPRSNHGVIVDFARKLKVNPNSLEILGDGTQNKSYMYIDDCIDAILHLTDVFVENREKVGIFNVGSSDQIAVRRIADIAAQELSLSNVSYTYTGAAEGGGGWVGDVRNMRLSAEKLKATGWKPLYNSEQAVRLAARHLLNMSQR